MENVTDAGSASKPWAAGDSWMKFYPQDFLGSPHVVVMTPLQRGHYITLLCVSWGLDGLTDEDVRVLMGADYETCWPKIRPCWQDGKDGRWRSPRQERERAAAIERRDQASAKARTRWDAASNAASIPASNAGGDAQHHAGSGLRAQKRIPTPTPPRGRGAFECSCCGIGTGAAGQCRTCVAIQRGHEFESEHEAHRHVHWTLWSSRRRRYVALRAVCFGGRAPAGEPPASIRERVREPREPLRDAWNRVVLGANGKPVFGPAATRLGPKALGSPGRRAEADPPRRAPGQDPPLPPASARG